MRGGADAHKIGVFSHFTRSSIGGRHRRRAHVLRVDDASEGCGQHPPARHDRFAGREKLGSTGFGGGIEAKAWLLAHESNSPTLW